MFLEISKRIHTFVNKKNAGIFVIAYVLVVIIN